MNVEGRPRSVGRAQLVRAAPGRCGYLADGGRNRCAQEQEEATEEARGIQRTKLRCPEQSNGNPASWKSPFS